VAKNIGAEPIPRAKPVVFGAVNGGAQPAPHTRRQSRAGFDTVFSPDVLEWLTRVIAGQEKVAFNGTTCNVKTPAIGT
jgi:hypothetical protein